MGCGKICKAKKEAKKAEEEADKNERDANEEAKAAKKQADAQKAAAGGNNSRSSTVTSYEVDVVTIGEFLGVDGKKNAISIREMQTLLATAKRSPEIMAVSIAKNLVNPLLGFMKAYRVLDFIRTAFRYVKPAVKIAMQINDIVTFNFAALGELVGDIAQMITQILLKFAPLLIEILKNLFFSIPLYVKLISKEQSIRIQQLLALSTISVKDKISNTITNFKFDNPVCPNAVAACDVLKATGESMTAIMDTYVQHDPLFVLEDLTDVPQFHADITTFIVEGIACARKTVLQEAIGNVDTEEIDILQIPDMQNETVENKNTMKAMLEGLLTVTKKTELATTEELLRQNFEASQTVPTEEGERYSDVMLAEAAADNIIQSIRDAMRIDQTAFNLTDGSVHPGIDICTPCKNELNAEVNKKLAVVESNRQEIITVSVAEELIQNNKIQIFDNIISSLTNVGFNPSDVILNDCMSYHINESFNTLKTNTIDNNFTTIDNAVIVDTQDMIDLKDLIYLNTVQAINDELIIADPTCGFDSSVCRAITTFKSNLVHEIEDNIGDTSINIGIADIPDYVDKYELTKTIGTFNDAINLELMDVIRAIVLESVLPCKACRPCEDMVADLVSQATKKIDFIKDEMIRNAGVFILDSSLDWTITDAQSIIDKKQQLVDAQNTAISTNAGSIDMFDAFITKLKIEEAAIISNISSVIKES